MTTATAITLTTAADGSLEVHSPYHPDFPAAARALGGRWRPSRRTWVFDGRDEAVVGDLLARLFGWSPAPSGKAVTVRVTLDRYNAGGAGPDRAALLAERDALLARLAELDALLAADGR